MAAHAIGDAPAHHRILRTDAESQALTQEHLGLDELTHHVLLLFERQRTCDARLLRAQRVRDDTRLDDDLAITMSCRRERPHYCADGEELEEAMPRDGESGAPERSELQMVERMHGRIID